ncbi:MAG TPA: hypothetical protein VM221_00340 [Armatimonadota bacterium]|nr:hypothetical protein [Armatimonadota bacterium]
MILVNSIMNAIFDVILRPFAGLSPWYGIAAVSLVTGVVMLLVFRYTSNQRALRRAKDRIRAHLLEVRLYRDDMGVLLRAQKDILLNNLAYLGHSLRPVAVMIVPVVLILVQLNTRYGYRPPRPGEAVILAAWFEPGADLIAHPPRLIAPPGLKVETPALRMPALHEVDWRIGAERPGAYVVRLVTAAGEVEKRITVASGWARVSPRRVGSGLWETLLNPGEAPLPAGAAVREITVGYAPAALPLWRWNVHWLVAFFVLSIAFGFALRGVFRVEI